MRMLSVLILKTVFVQLRLILEHRILAAVLSIFEDSTITLDSNKSRAFFVKWGMRTYGLSASPPPLTNC